MWREYVLKWMHWFKLSVKSRGRRRADWTAKDPQFVTSLNPDSPVAHVTSSWEAELN